MTKFALLTLTCLPLLVAAQDSKQDTKPDTNTHPAKEAIVTKVIHLRYAHPEAVRELLFNTGGVNVAANNGMKALVVRGAASQIPIVEQTIKELDVPQASEATRDVELTFYIVGATNRPGESAPPPPDLAPVIKQLKAVFPYVSYTLLDTVLMRGHEGKMSDSGGELRAYPNTDASSHSSYHINCTINPKNLPDDGAIHLEQFIYQSYVAKFETRIQTDLDLRPGQKIVAGQTNIDDGNSALFIVVTGKYVE